MSHFVLNTHIKDTDWEPLYVMDVKCFIDEPAIACFCPHGVDPAHLSTSVQSFKSHVFGGPTERAIACIRDSKSEKIVSYISCRVYRDRKGIVEGQSAQAPPLIQLPGLKDPDERSYWEWFWTKMRSCVRNIKELHQPVIVIQVLATDPDWQQRGAASMLLNWLFNFAAEAKLRVAVQPGPLAVRLGFYERFGFQVCQELTVIDKRRYLDRGGVYAPMLIKDHKD